MCVCVREREREGEIERVRVCVSLSLSLSLSLPPSLCECGACVRERERVCVRAHECVFKVVCMGTTEHTIHGKHTEITNRSKEARRSVCTHIMSCSHQEFFRAQQVSFTDIHGTSADIFGTLTITFGSFADV